MVGDGHRQAEGQHSLEVHRPDANAHRGCAAAQPSQANPAPCGGHATRKVEPRVGRGNGYEHGARYFSVVIGTWERRVCGDRHNGSLALAYPKICRPN